MWLHIRGVGEWTNRLYSYFEKEQERLHNGEVPASIPGSSKAITSSGGSATAETSTPQKDFLSKNLARISHSPMVKSSSFENSRGMDELNGHLNRNSEKKTSIHREDETELKENPFVFDASPPLRPPRHGPGTSKLATDNFSVSSPPKFERQISEGQTTIKKIQASLQRTFSRKGTAAMQSQLSDSNGGSGGGGSTNEGFIGDDNNELQDYKVTDCLLEAVEIVY